MYGQHRSDAIKGAGGMLAVLPIHIQWEAVLQDDGNAKILQVHLQQACDQVEKVPQNKRSDLTGAQSTSQLNTKSHHESV